MASTPSANGERIIMVQGEHWLKYVAPTALYLLLAGTAVLLFMLAELSVHHYMWLSHVTFIAGLTLFLFVHHWYFIVLLSEELDGVIVTNRRLLHIRYRMLFHEDITEVSIEKMKSVEAMKSGFLQNLLGYGTLTFEGTKARVTLVPHPNRVAHTIQDAVQHVSPA